MAMTRRMGGSGQGRPYDPQGPGRVPTMGSYENFKPRSELKEEDGALLLLVYLPGYLQRQITYSKDESARRIRLSGERMLANNRRQRFNFSHRVPEDCNFNEIKPHFQSGTFTIRIPKIITAAKATTPPEQEGTTKTTQYSSTRPQETNETRIKPQREQRQDALRALEPKVGTTFEKGQYKDTPKATISGDRSTSSSKKDHSNNVADGKKVEVVEGKIKEINEKSVEENRSLMVNAGVAVVVIMALGAHMFSHFIGSRNG